MSGTSTFIDMVYGDRCLKPIVFINCMKSNRLFQMSQRRDPPVNLSPRELIKVPQLVFTGIHNSHNNPGHFWLLGFYDEAHSHNRNLNMMLIQVTVKWKIYSYPVAKWICNLTTHTDPPTTTPSSYQYTTLVSQVCKETHTHRRQVNREGGAPGEVPGTNRSSFKLQR